MIIDIVSILMCIMYTLFRYPPVAYQFNNNNDKNKKETIRRRLL